MQKHRPSSAFDSTARWRVTLSPWGHWCDSLRKRETALCKVCVNGVQQPAFPSGFFIEHRVPQLMPVACNQSLVSFC